MSGNKGNWNRDKQEDNMQGPSGKGLWMRTENQHLMQFAMW